MSTTALVPQDLIAPRGVSVVTSAVYKVRVSLRARWNAWRASLAETAEGISKNLDAMAARIRIALDPSVSRTLAAYRVSDAAALPRRAEAPLAADADAWVQPVALAAAWLDLDHRRELARHWLSQAQSAHGAIAAYTGLAGELMSLGAHPQLLMHVHAAALERVHHAEGAFSLASAYAGFGISPGAWPELPRIARASTRTHDDALIRVAEHALLEGWLSTRFGAAVAHVAAARAMEPAVAAHLRMVAEDSARQAEFGLRLVDWTLRLGGDRVVLALALAVRNLPRALLEAPFPRGMRTDVLSRHGLLDPSLRRALYLSTRAEVVRELGRRLDAFDLRQRAKA